MARLYGSYPRIEPILLIHIYTFCKQSKASKTCWLKRYMRVMRGEMKGDRIYG